MIIKTIPEPIPDHFNDDEEAGNFWDTHFAADYWDEMEEVEIEFRKLIDNPIFTYSR